MTKFIIGGLLISFICGIACKKIAKATGRRPMLWFFIGFLFNILGLLVLGILTVKRKTPPQVKQIP